MLQRGLRAKGGFLFIKVKANSAMAAFLRQELKRYCTKEGCSSNALMYTTNAKPGKEVHFTSGLSSSVGLEGYMTWVRSDVSS